MQTESVLRKFETLPPAAQKEVVDFIDFLMSRYENQKSKTVAKSTSLTQEEFVGIWENRENMAYSSMWVKKLRQTEWDK